MDGLLRDLGSRLQRGSRALALERAPRLATGLPDIDALVGGGFPTGRLSEIAGPASSGRTSVGQALLARATRSGETVALVDVAAAFDPPSAHAAGVVLERVLWVRPPALRQAVRCCECLQDAHGFALVLLDLARGDRSELPASTWQRLARSASGTGTALVVLSEARTTGTHAELVLEMEPGRAHFSGTRPLLEGLSIEARVARHRSGPAQRVASVRLSTTRAA
ncbi:MAG: hypothetical protein ACQGVC_08285 [Myxococcota bacterium]